MLLLLNTGRVNFRFFFVEMSIPLFFIIAFATLFGILVAYVFVSLGSREKRLRDKVKHYERSIFSTKNETIKNQ